MVRPLGLLLTWNLPPTWPASSRHTGAGQALTGIHIHLGLIQESLPDPPESVRIALQRIGVLTHDALEQVQGISRGL